MAKIFDNIKKFPSQIGHQFQKLHKPMKSSEKRANLRKELFHYKQCAQFGFLEKPCKLAYDAKLKLLAIASRDGVLKVFGLPGVEYTAQHVLSKNVEVLQVVFVPQQARLLTLTSDWLLHHWEINNDVLEEVRKLNLHCADSNASSDKSAVAAAEEKNDAAAAQHQQGAANNSAWSLSVAGDELFVGNEAGSLYTVAVTQDSLRLVQVLSLAEITANVPREHLRLGALVHISPCPTQADRILLGFELGTLLVYNLSVHLVELVLPATQMLTDASWLRDGHFVKSCHQDGSYIVWPISHQLSNPHGISIVAKPLESATMPYGPFPCKAITKLFWKTAKLGTFIMFAGGMPRASYGDKHTVTLMRGEDEHVCLDLSSRVVDLLVLCGPLDDESDEDVGDFDEPHTLFILCEEELVAVDLRSVGWPLFELPYLQSVHCSSVTALSHCAGKHCASIVSSLRDIKRASTVAAKLTSPRTWPVSGGRIFTKESGTRSVADCTTTLPKDEELTSMEHLNEELILTGHKDGSVAFWILQATRICLSYVLKTTVLFSGRFGSKSNEMEEEDWPPFRRIGQFDSSVDDARVAITCIELVDDMLLLGGAAGQVSTWCISNVTKEIEVDLLKVTAEILEKEKQFAFVWKGSQSLMLHEGVVEFAAGWHPTSVIQVLPASAVSAIAAAPKWQLFAIGTAHGLAVIDTVANRVVYTYFTVPPTDATHVDSSESTSLSRSKKLRQSLRQSFRKLRNLENSTLVADNSGGKQDDIKCSTSAAAAEGVTAQPDQNTETVQLPCEDNKELVGEVVTNSDSSAIEDAIDSTAKHEEEKLLENGALVAPRELDGYAGLVRCLRFATVCLTGTNVSPTLWAGTNSGHALAFQVTLPNEKDNELRSEKLRVQLCKDVHLVHGAPVIQLFLIKGQKKAAYLFYTDLVSPRELLLVSEEQVKLFSLPSLKPRHKNKMASVDGARMRAAGLAQFQSTNDPNYIEKALMVSNSLDQIVVLNLPKLVRQSAGLFGGANSCASLVTLGAGNEKRPFGVSLVNHRQLRLFTMAAIADDQYSVKFTVDVAEGMRPAAATQPDDVAEGMRPAAATQLDETKKDAVETAADETEQTAASSNDATESRAGDVNLADVGDAVVPASLVEGEASTGMAAGLQSEGCEEEKHGDITLDNITEYLTDRGENMKPCCEKEKDAVCPETFIKDDAQDKELSLEEKHAKNSVNLMTDDVTSVVIGELQ